MMAQPVWVLSVDLQTKTATFQTGLADAAKAARGSFNDIKGGAGEMGGAVSYSTMEARHSVMMLGEEFGVHLPRALSSFIAGLGPIGPALEAAFPFLAIAGLATILIEALVKMHEAGEKLTDDQMKFGTAAQNAFNALDEKLIQSQIHADELRNDHLGALKLQLELINRQSMSELAHAFDELAKSADAVMKDLEGHWYTVGIGSAGASHALDQFKVQYDSLLAAGKDEQAAGLLTGTLAQAQKVLAFQKEGAANSGTLTSAPKPGADISKSWEAQNGLKAAGVGWTEKEIQAQEMLVQALQDQVTMAEKISAIKKQDSSNAKTGVSNEAAAQNAAAARQAAESMMRMGEQSVAADKATADAILAVKRASIEARLANDIDFAGRERDVQLAGNAAELAALDKSGKDYTNQVKANKEKALEISNEYSTKVAEMTAKASIEEATRDMAATQQSLREKIEATRQGSAERLSVIVSAIKQEESANLQDTNFFRELLNMRVETARQEAEEESKLREQAGIKAAEDEQKQGLLTVAAARGAAAVESSLDRQSREQLIQQEISFANQEFAIKQTSLEKEIAALDKSGKEYNNKLKQLQDQEKQLTQQHENELAAIREKAEIETNNKLTASYQQFTSAIAGELTKTITGHQSMARMVESLGDEMVTSMIKNAVMYAMSNKTRQESDAKAAASAGFKLGMEIGGPAAPVLAPVFAAAAFAGAIAFEGGGVVPGIGRGDIVPTMLEPGEGVVPGGVMDGLSKMARNGGFDRGNHIHIHGVQFAPRVQAFDADGVDRVLDDHQEKFQQHFERTLRKMNR